MKNIDKNEFINIVMGHSKYSDRQDAERSVVAVFHVLRSQLSDEEHIDIHYALPEDIENLWVGGWLQRFISRIQSIRILDRNDFIEQVREVGDLSSKDEAEDAIKAVFFAIKSILPKLDIKHIQNELTNGVLDMWNAA